MACLSNNQSLSLVLTFIFIIIIFSGEQKAHIPGAKNIPYAMLFNEDETFKSIEDLKEGKYT